MNVLVLSLRAEFPSRYSTPGGVGITDTLGGAALEGGSLISVKGTRIRLLGPHRLKPLRFRSNRGRDCIANGGAREEVDDSKVIGGSLGDIDWDRFGLSATICGLEVEGVVIFEPCVVPTTIRGKIAVWNSECHVPALGKIMDLISRELWEVRQGGDLSA